MRNLSLTTIFSAFLLAPAYAVNVERTDANFNLDFVEGSRVDFSLSAEVNYTDNFLYSQEDKQSTLGYSINPSAFLQAHNDNHLFQVVTDVTRNQYVDFEEDNHTDTVILGKYFYKLAPDHRLFISGSLDNLYQFRGQGLSKGNAQSVDTGDKRQDTMVNLGYQFGRVESVSRFNLLVGAENSEYKTRRSSTYLYDFNRGFIQAELDYLIGAKTYLSSVLTVSDYDYENSDSLSRTETTALAGINWEVTTASKLKLLVGSQQIGFDSYDSNNNKFSWLASYHWRPNDFMSFTLSSSRKTEDDAEAVTDFKITDFYQANFNYLMNDYLRIIVNVANKHSDVIFNQQERDESELYSNVTLNYKYSNWLSASFAVSYTENDSEVALFSYDRQLMSLGVDILF